MARALSFLVKSELGSSFLFEHDLFRKPVPTFRDHALELELALRHARDRAAHRGLRIILRVELDLPRLLGAGEKLDQHQCFVETRRDPAAGEAVAVEDISRIALDDVNLAKLLET